MAEKTIKKDVFVGREEEIETIKNIIRDNPKANILISGLTGMGKTELCIRVKELLSQDNSIHCGSYRVESKLEDPVNPFLTALLEVFQSVTAKEKEKSKLTWFKDVLAKKVWEKRKDIGGAIAKDAVGTILKIIYEKIEFGETTSELAEILKDASSEWTTKSTLEKLLLENKEAVIISYLMLLREISEQSPSGHRFVLILDQVEIGSEFFQEFLKSIARNLPDKFYLIFALNNEVTEGVEFLNNHKADLIFFKTKLVELEGLNNLEIRQLIEEIRGVYKTPDVVEKARRLSDGRPLMIIQWINTKDFDLSIIDEEKFRLYGYYIDSLKTIGNKAKMLATILSILPFPLKAGIIDYAGIMGIEYSECFELLEELQNRNIFRKYPGGYWFNHDLIKEYIFDNTDNAIKKDIALRAINYLKKKYTSTIKSNELSELKTSYVALLSFTNDYLNSFKQSYDLGMYNYAICSYQVAKQCFEWALRASQNLKNRHWESIALVNIGLIYKTWGKYDTAMGKYDESLKIAEEIGDQKQQGVILNNIALIYRSRGKYDAAITNFKKSLKIAKTLSDRRGIGITLNNIGMVYKAMGKYNECIECYNKSLKISEEMGNRKGEGVTLNNIGMVYYAWGKYDQAIEYYQKSLKITEELGDRQGEGATRNNIGMVYYAWGKYDQAIEYYQKSLKITEELGDRQGEGATRNNIGMVYYAWGKYDQAIEYYQKSLKITEEIGDRQGEGVTLNNIGEIYRAWGKYDQAIEYYLKSLKIKKDIEDRQGEAVTLTNIGEIYRAWGKYDQAIEYYQKSLKITEEIGDRQGEGVTLNNVGELYRSWGKYDQAIEYYKKSLKISEEIGDRRQQGTSLRNITMIYYALGMYTQAIKCSKKALKIFEEIKTVIEAKAAIELLEEVIQKSQGRKDLVSEEDKSDTES
jgi:tetratricopeptide (TPR) repeat protein